MNMKLAKILRFTGAVLILVFASLGVKDVLRRVMPIPQPGPRPPVMDKDTSPFYLAEGAIGHQLDGSYVFTDKDGASFDIASWYDKPMVVSYVFTSCTEVCPMVTASLAKIVRENKERFGKDFRIVTIGFETEKDTPKAMAKFAATHNIDSADWKFLSGSKETVAALAKKLGVTYKFEPGKGWLHYIGVTMVAPGGKVAAQLFGPDYSNEQFFDKLAAATGRPQTDQAAKR
ncbi:MAG: SCO family protein [Nitrospinae bacterium]|nr:SCO family protein [Nitrospinota bacterium]